MCSMFDAVGTVLQYGFAVSFVWTADMFQLSDSGVYDEENVVVHLVCARKVPFFLVGMSYDWVIQK